MSLFLPSKPGIRPFTEPNFPNEIVTEILSRLPMKSLARFKCVSKSWHSLISGPPFIKPYSSEHEALIFSLNGSPNLLKHELHYVSSLLHAPTSETSAPGVIDIGDAPECPSKSFEIVDSCDGLVCIYTIWEKELFLWNPLIKNLKKLPLASLQKRVGNCVGRFGFGYDKLNNDYKVVGLFSLFSRKLMLESKTEVYSLKNDSWRVVEGVGFQRLSGAYCPPRCASGKLCWLDRDNSKIDSFDLADETYEETDLPIPDNFENSGLCYRIGVVGGCVSVLYNRPTHVDVWVLMEHGVKDSWAKVVSTPHIAQDVYHWLPHSVWLSRNGEFLLVSNAVGSISTGSVILYNQERNTLRRLPEIGRVDKVITYAESLVSPNAHAVESDNCINLASESK